MKLASVQFDQGIAPTIAVVNKATVDLGVDLSTLIAAMQTDIDTMFGPIWGVSCTLMRAQKVPSKAWAMLLTNDADAANALGYHDLTSGGFPILKVFVKTTLADGELVSVTCSHELHEGLVDPAINGWRDGPKGFEYAEETDDPVESAPYNVVNGVPLSNFVTPAWFEGFRKPGSARFDYLKQCKAPFQLLKGGYAIVRKAGKVSQIFADGPNGAKAKRFAKEDRRQHRSEYRRAA